MPKVNLARDPRAERARRPGRFVGLSNILNSELVGRKSVERSHG